MSCARKKKKKATGKDRNNNDGQVGSIKKTRTPKQQEQQPSTRSKMQAPTQQTRRNATASTMASPSQQPQPAASKSTMASPDKPPSSARKSPDPLASDIKSVDKSTMTAAGSTMSGVNSTRTNPASRSTTLKVERRNSDEKVPSAYVSMPKSRDQRSVRSNSLDVQSRGSSDGPSSLRRFKEFSARALRKVKTFVSRPVNEATLKKVAHRVEERKKLEQKQSTHQLTHGEDMFPKQKPSRKRNSSRSAKDNVFAPIQSNAEEQNVVKVGTLPSGTVLVKNNDNNGRLFLDKKGTQTPFWTTSRRPSDDDLDSVTDDDLQLNAEVVLDVMNGQVKLVSMPTIPVVLDPFNDMSQLQGKDKLFYNRDVLFGNTVRTMINLSDPLSQRLPQRRRNQTPMKITEPRKYKSYVEGNWTTFTDEPFTSRSKTANSE